MRTYAKDLEAENDKLRAIVELLIEEVDDPCRRRQPNDEAVFLSDPLIRLARAAIS